MKCIPQTTLEMFFGVAPARERGLKYKIFFRVWLCYRVAPARERGLKLLTNAGPKIMLRRSREGAWIEISACAATAWRKPVAPARERGLKCADLTYQQGVNKSRSREGAWIEIICWISSQMLR